MPSNDTPKIIFLNGSPKGREALAAAAGILPGMLVEGVPGGSVAVHAAAGGAAAKSFARPNEVVGSGIDTAYADGDTVLYGIAGSGDAVYGFIADAANVVAGDYLQSNGAGSFVVQTAGTPGTAFPGIALTKALETFDNTAGGAPARLKLEVL